MTGEGVRLVGRREPKALGTRHDVRGQRERVRLFGIDLRLRLGALGLSDAMIQPSQCRAARALLEWTQPNLAEQTGLGVVTIRSFEKGGEMRDRNRNLLRMTLEAAGVEFIPENGGGAGVRLRKG